MTRQKSSLGWRRAGTWGREQTFGFRGVTVQQAQAEAAVLYQAMQSDLRLNRRVATRMELLPAGAGPASGQRFRFRAANGWSLNQKRTRMG
jgi:hypothetical protein